MPSMRTKGMPGGAVGVGGSVGVPEGGRWGAGLQRWEVAVAGAGTSPWAGPGCGVWLAGRAPTSGAVSRGCVASGVLPFAAAQGGEEHAADDQRQDEHGAGADPQPGDAPRGGACSPGQACAAGGGGLPAAARGRGERAITGGGVLASASLGWRSLG